MSITNLYLDFGDTRIVADGYITRLPQALFSGGGGGLAQTSHAAVSDEPAVRRSVRCHRGQVGGESADYRP